jgi:hypothetical protein
MELVVREDNLALVTVDGYSPLEQFITDPYIAQEQSSPTERECGPRAYEIAGAATLSPHLQSVEDERRSLYWLSPEKCSAGWSCRVPSAVAFLRCGLAGASENSGFK